MSKKYWKLLAFLILSIINIIFAQEKNPTVWPYGGMPDGSRFIKGLGGSNRFGKSDKIVPYRVPLNFKKAYFRSVHFNSHAYFENARFSKQAYFAGAKFDGLADFKHTKFDSLVNFEWAQFGKQAYFGSAIFGSQAKFEIVRFDGWAYFKGANFGKLADFRAVNFGALADFGSARFGRQVTFLYAKFGNQADFGYAEFNREASFNCAQFKDKIIFNSAIINNQISFMYAKFDSLAIADFSLAEIKDTLFIGNPNSNKLQKYNFLLANLIEKHKEVIKSDTVVIARGDTIYRPQKENNYPGAKIILYGPVVLKIQLEKFKFIELCNTLDYYLKKNIIMALKDSSFNEAKHSKERFELDYIFAKSTMYQEQSTRYELNKWYEFWKWFPTFIYYITMGLGYRPFRLVYWILFIIVYYAIKYFRRMPYEIDTYVKHQSNLDKSNISESISIFGTFLKCFYFSAMVFFTFRLKSDILAFFNPKDQRIIIFEWLLGFGVYIAFLTLSKAGSILHTLKSLFVG